MDFEKLSDIIKDENRIKIGTDIEDKYLSDALNRNKGKADVLIFPINTEEVSSIMKIAYENGIPVTPRGAGTGLVGATIPTRGGIILDLSLMKNIVELDENTLTVTVQPGILLVDLQKFVESKGFFYPPDPGEKNASIGGNISTNAGGMRAVKYGVTRDYVMGLEVVLADGTILNTGGKVIKNSSGLDIKDLIIGSEGTLAIITRAILKLIPKPKKSISAIIPFNSLKEGIDTVIKIIKKNANPTAIEFMESDVIENAERFLKLKFPSDRGKAYLLLTFDGDEEFEIESNYKKVKEVALENNALDFILLDKKDDIERTWKIRGALVTAVEAVSEQEPIDIVVPIDRSADFINYTKVAEKEFGIKISSFGHAGDGNVHLCVIRNGMEENLWNEKSRKLLKALYRKGKELNGLPSGEHGIGINKKPYFIDVTDKINVEYMRRIKKAFDEKGILNYGKSYSI
ncbi:FAD-binding oxidoreductase [Clostridium tyrobutyricum]|uniref:FAD-binding oxidoreductase n=1 Tax=Clostridium tyrobutyricum TaxID=1519 RepID=UPI001C389B1B|nr:FAD-binding oxidoreductase [Clostridium tyrobutyricum]MBV4426421.1 FAD-binding oxidoreductase [Clostridium tyrobutyricum]